MRKLHLTILALILSVASYAIGPITGTFTVCPGSTTTLSCTPGGGTWSATGSAATIGASTGVVTGLTTGVAFITYTDGVSSATATVTVNPVPTAISGTAVICLGGTTTLTDATAGGVWSSSNVAIATISTSTGIATGISLGITTVSYTLASGCSATRTVTVTSTPGTISGPSTVCTGASINLTNSVSGGTWVSSNTSVATITSTGGVATGVAAGTATITYSMGGSCLSTTVITVVSGPTAITGSATLCTGYTTTLASTPSGGTWTSSTPAVAPVSSGAGIVSGASAGTSTITYTLGSGCYATRVVTVYAAPPAIGGPTSVCSGSTITLTDAASGGTWSTAASCMSLGMSTGVLTGLSACTGTVTYTLASGCYSTAVITVSAGVGTTSGATTLCVGSSVTYSNTVSGGTWVSSNPTILSIDPTTGVGTGNAAGSTSITYSLGGSCYAMTMITVNPLPAAISGSTSLCGVGTTTLTDATAGGVWTSSATSVATVTSAGVVTGIGSGTATIYYTLASTGCATSVVVSVGAAPVAYTVAGGGSYCPGAGSGPAVTLSGSSAGVSYQLYNGSAAVGSPIMGTGSALAFSVPASAGTYSILATSGSCTSAMVGTATVSAASAPTITTSATAASCGGSFSLSASGADTYVWYPSAGLSCSTCATTNATLSASTVYTVVGTVTATGCTGAATLTVSANRIIGHVLFGSGAPSVPTSKVWLVQYDPSDSSLTALDSTLTCNDGGSEYYEFSGKPAGSYLVKAKLQSAVTGTSDYVPTYGLSSTIWSSGTSISHTTSATNTQDINMIYGTVPAGPGFIGGLIVSGAGKNTASDAPAVGMAVYLLNTASNVLTYTTTNSSGMYSFSGLAHGTYIVYPEAFSYMTTPSDVITISSAVEIANGVNFKQHTTSGTITPFDATVIPGVNQDPNVSLYPNPTSGNLNIKWTNKAAGTGTVVITDISGRMVYNSSIEITAASGNTVVDLSSIEEGIYFISIKSATINSTSKLLISK